MNLLYMRFVKGFTTRDAIEINTVLLGIKYRIFVNP